MNNKICNITPHVFDTGIVFVGDDFTIIIKKYPKDAFLICNHVMDEHEIKDCLEPTPFYGEWGSKEGWERKEFFDQAKRILTRNEYLNLVGPRAIG